MVPLIWNTAAGLDQDKVFKIVYTRARWVADTDVRRAYAATTRAAAMEDTARPLRLKLIKRLRQKGPADRDRDRDELDLDWALQQYVDQEGACFYTGVTLTLSGPIYTTPFVLSFERRDESLGYTAGFVLTRHVFVVGKPIPPRRVGNKHVQFVLASKPAGIWPGATACYAQSRSSIQHRVSNPLTRFRLIPTNIPIAPFSTQVVRRYNQTKLPAATAHRRPAPPGRRGLRRTVPPLQWSRRMGAYKLRAARESSATATGYVRLATCRRRSRCTLLVMRKSFDL